MTRGSVGCAALMATTASMFLTAADVQQEPSLEFGKVAVFHSAVLNEDRRLNVFLPASYGSGIQKYPVIYLLDGSAHEDYLHATGLFDFLATYGVMPPSIIVGISNVDRRRDFTMPSSDPADLKTAPTSGGAAKFLTFVERELIPYVEGHYRVNDRRTLIGQSLAGLFATQVLLEQPRLFNDYVIVSASLWWNKQALLQSAADGLKKNRAPARRVYISVADEPPEMQTAAERLVKLMKDLRPDITYFYEYLPAETHATSLHISLYNAMHLLNDKGTANAPLSATGSQAQPNFAGRWIPVPPEPGAPTPPGLSSWNGEVTLTQDETTFVVEYVSSGRAHAPVKFVYNFDGSERSNVDPNSVEPQRRITRAAWRGSRIVLTTVWPGRQNPGDERPPVETTEVLSLDSPTTMSVEITRRSETRTDTGTVTYRRR